MKNNRGVRKGAWTYEEDKLLKACINKHGEGKWHLVPHRAGLNRCRKSCRLRWLNYLSPVINREGFSEDEVDMILRLHKLLGNRWALIAARLPGRTANDVKNYWHTHLQKKKVSIKLEEENEKEKPMKSHEVIKPKPRKLNVKPIVPVSAREVTVAKDNDDKETMVQNEMGNDCVDALQPSLGNDCVDALQPSLGNDCVDALQPSLGNDPILSAVWWDSFLNLGEQECSEKNGSCSLLQEEDFVLEFPKVDDFSWDSNLCDFGSVWDL